MSGGQNVRMRSGTSERSTKRSNAEAVRRPTAHAPIATPPASPASRTRKTVARQLRRTRSAARIRTASKVPSASAVRSRSGYLAGQAIGRGVNSPDAGDAPAMASAARITAAAV